jgi:hypothetical protein
VPASRMAGRAHYARTPKVGVLSGAAPLLDSMSALEVLRRITTGLEDAGIAYMLTGSLASAHHGAPRSTVHIDIVIAGDPNQLRAFVQSLPSKEYYVDLNAALDAHSRDLGVKLKAGMEQC